MVKSKKYYCGVCEKYSEQKGHHEAHLQSKDHKQNCEIMKLKLQLDFHSKSLDDIYKEYPQYKNNQNIGINDSNNQLKEKIIHQIIEDKIINKHYNDEEKEKEKDELDIKLENTQGKIKGTFDDIKDIMYKMQCILRNEEGITGINAMHHQNLCLLICRIDKTFSKKLNIPEELCYENIKNLQEVDLYHKIYNPSNQRNCLLYYIRNANIGYSKDIPFEIKSQKTLPTLFKYCEKIDLHYYFDNTDLIGDMYEHFINREGKTMKDLGQYFTDRSLIKYLVNLCNPTYENGNIQSFADFAAGTGGFLQSMIQH